jgi:uncharacterized alpha/beta hydrolase family protein
MQTIFITAGVAIMGIQLLFIIQKIKKMSTLQERSNADIATILAAIVGIGGDISTIAQEITDLKNQEATGQDQIDTVAKLDDLATKATAAATALHALIPPAGNTGEPPLPGGVNAGASEGAGSDQAPNI